MNMDDESLDELNQVYLDTRYPADYGILPKGVPSLRKAESFKVFAETVYQRVEHIFKDRFLNYASSSFKLISNSGIVNRILITPNQGK